MRKDLSQFSKRGLLHCPLIFFLRSFLPGTGNSGADGGLSTLPPCYLVLSSSLIRFARKESTLVAAFGNCFSAVLPSRAIRKLLSGQFNRGLLSGKAHKCLDLTKYFLKNNGGHLHPHRPWPGTPSFGAGGRANVGTAQVGGEEDLEVTVFF